MESHATSRACEPLSDLHAQSRRRCRSSVAGAAPYVDKGLCCRSRNQPAIVRGVLPTEEGKVSVLGQKMVKGQGRLDSLVAGRFNIILGKELAIWLGVGVGDSVVVTTSDFRSTPLGAVPQLKRFTVSGIFEAGYSEFDRGMAFANMHDMQRVLRMGDGVTGVRLKLHDMDRAFEVARDLASSARAVRSATGSENEHVRAVRWRKTIWRSCCRDHAMARSTWCPQVMWHDKRPHRILRPLGWHARGDEVSWCRARLSA